MSSDAAKADRPQLWSVHLMRSAATVGVVVYHCFAAMHPGEPVLFGGVSIFFLLTGFLVWVLTAGRTISAGEFLYNRVTRIAPMYWVATLGFAAAWLVKPKLFWFARGSLGDVVASLLFIPHRNIDGHPWPIVLQGWTLEIDALFYLLFAAALLFASRPFRLAAMSGVLLALAVAGAVLKPESPIAAAYTSPLLVSFALGLGMGEAWVRGWLPGRLAGALLAVVGLASFFIMGFARMGPGAWAWQAGGFALCLGLVTLEFRGWALRSPWLKSFGEISYAVYLTHTLAITAVFIKAPGVGAPLTVALSVLLAVLIGAVAFYGVEQPINRFFSMIGRRVSGRDRATSVVIAARVGPG